MRSIISEKLTVSLGIKSPQIYYFLTFAHFDLHNRIIMKKFLTLLVCIFTTTLFSQQKIAQRVAELKTAKTVFKPYSILTPSVGTPSSKIANVVEKASFASIRTSDVNAIVSQKPEAIEVNVPYLGNELTIELYRVDLLHDDFQIDTDKRKNIEYNAGAYYRGIVKNDAHSVVSMNFFQGELSGIISADNVGNVVVGKIDEPGNTQNYIVYSDADMKVMNPFSCGMKIDADDANYSGDQQTTDRSIESTRCVTIYFELDYNLYLQNGSNTATATNWMTSVFNNTATLYANDGISTSLKSMFIWTTQDPYSGTSSGDYLYGFNEFRPVFNGDVGMLVGIDPGGLGGVAVTINGLCTANNFSYSDVDFSYASVPTFSWTVEVITHELGHLLGSPHTHGCYWNNNNTAIDGCGTQAGYQEGNCAIGPIPSSSVKGTIMSYCHLVSGVGINFNNGFGPQPTARIFTAVNGGNCLSTDCINTCINTVSNIQATNITASGATITWTDLPSVTQWQILVNPFASNFGVYQTVSTPSYNATGLSANTFYKARIRPVCGTGMQSALRQVVFATAANWCTGITITDTGGANGDYTNDQNYTRVMIPNVASKKIRLAFTQFDLEADYDYLYVYDGSSTSATDLTNGGLTGENMQAPFPVYESSAADGSLTLRFFSDQGVVESGYTATVSCLDNLGVNENQMIDFTYYPNPTKDAVNIVSKTQITNVEVYNVAGQLLYSNKANALETKVDMMKYSTGTYFFKVKFGEYSANFKVMKF